MPACFRPICADRSRSSAAGSPWHNTMRAHIEPKHLRRRLASSPFRILSYRLVALLAVLGPGFVTANVRARRSFIGPSRQIRFSERRPVRRQYFPMPRPNPAVLWPPNGKFVDVEIRYSVQSVCPVSTTLTVSSSELPATGGAAEWIVIGPPHVQLQAERLGSGSGRLQRRNHIDKRSRRHKQSRSGSRTARSKPLASVPERAIGGVRSRAPGLISDSKMITVH